MVTKLIPVLDPSRPSAKIRGVQAALRAIVTEDQKQPALCASCCEVLDRIESQLDRAAGLQELFEWYSSMPAQ